MSLYDVIPVSVADYRLRARRRLPRFLFDYIEGGARGVLIGRPWVYAMACCGENRVVDMLELSRREIATAMALMGVTSIGEITSDLIERA
jgi:L-lactate dehydrogenase (cytochrome)